MGFGEAMQDRKLFIGGLAPQTDSNSLKDYYSKWGEIVDVVVMKDNNTGRSRGFGFVTYSEATMAEQAVADGPHTIDGKTTDTKRAISKDSMDDKSGPTDKVFVGGLTCDITSNQLREYFETFGSVKEASVMSDKATGESRCFAFVIFDEMSTVDRVMESKPHNLQGCQIDVQKAVTREEMRRKAGSKFGSHNRNERDRRDTGRYHHPYYDRGYDQWNPGYYHHDYYGGYYDQGYYSYGGYGHPDPGYGPMRGHYPSEGYDYYQPYGSGDGRGDYNRNSSKPRGSHTPYNSDSTDPSYGQRMRPL